MGSSMTEAFWNGCLQRMSDTQISEPRLTPVSREAPVGMSCPGMGALNLTTDHELMEHTVGNGEGSLSSVFKASDPTTMGKQSHHLSSVLGRRQPNTETADHLCKRILLWVSVLSLWVCVALGIFGFSKIYLFVCVFASSLVLLFYPSLFNIISPRVWSGPFSLFPQDLSLVNFIHIAFNMATNSKSISLCSPWSWAPDLNPNTLICLTYIQLAPKNSPTPPHYYQNIWTCHTLLNTSSLMSDFLPQIYRWGSGGMGCGRVALRVG